MIVTIDSPQSAVLRQKTELIRIEELPLANEIADKLHAALKPHLPAAGLAAPQIGISKAVFIYSYDRDPAHLETVINPQYAPTDDRKVEGWEGCFSCILTNGNPTVAKIPRYERINVTYLNAAGEKVVKKLEGFGAKAFQHEYDHLQGMCVVDRKDAVVKKFDSEAEMKNFLQAVKRDDATRYVAPK